MGRPDKIVVVIITDGQENTSRKFTKKDINKLVAKHDDWEFIFLGANQDAISEGSKYSMRKAQSATWDASNSAAMWNTVSETLSSYVQEEADAEMDYMQEIDPAEEMSEVEREEARRTWHKARNHKPARQRMAFSQQARKKM